MPDSAGILSLEDNQKIQRWWVQQWKAPVVCPVCKTSEWTQAPHVVNIPRHAVDAYVADTINYPHIAVTCNSCAHSMFFNAVQIGVSASAPHAATVPAPPPPNPFALLTTTSQPASPSSNPFDQLPKKDR
jgi:hypothetical protein